MDDWPTGKEDNGIQTLYRQVHMLECGPPDSPPILMLHMASMGAHSWAENPEPLVRHCRIYVVDNPEEGNKSELLRVATFPGDAATLAERYATLADSLNIDRADVFGALNRGFIAMSFALYYPGRVKPLSFFGPRG